MSRVFFFFFFFKQKTAYEMRISDWSSDVCSSDLYLILALNDRDRTIEGWKLGQGSDWIDQMLYGGMLACAERGYRMIFELIDTHSTQVEREVNAALSSLRPDGVILTPPHSDRKSTRLNSSP